MKISAMDEVLAQLRAASAVAAGKSTQVTPKDAAGGVDFSAVLKSAVDQVNGAQQQAGRLAQDFELGKSGTNLQDVMLSMQKANISFQTMVQVRNKLVSAYHDIMNMQV